jgi:para-nitrobenzyl esterase
MLCRLMAAVLLVACGPARAQTANLFTGAAPAVGVTGGQVVGADSPDGAVHAYKGIPFATPPTGDLRWRPPLPPAGWQGILAATHFAPACMQALPPPGSFYQREFFHTTEPSSEDCLYLNVWTGARSAQERRPVMVWIYGGGFVQGSGSLDTFNGDALARRGVVLVTFNYRVGPFGFLALPALSAESPVHVSGNYGLLDEIAALRWVHDNIAAFGGDPDRVTIFGQSAGAVSTNVLMTSPLARGLFQRAIVESGSAFGFFDRRPTLAQAERDGADFAGALGAGDPASLRALPAAKLLAAAGRFRAWPVIDGWVVPEDPPRAFGRGSENVTAVMIGSNDDEGTALLPAQSAAAFAAAARARFGDGADTYLRLYPTPDDAAVADAGDRALSDELAAGSREQAHLLAAAGRGAWLYHFDRRAPGPDGSRYGAFHSAELVYVFGTQDSVSRPWTPLDRHLSEVMMGYWTNFADHGDPNGPGLPEWPAYAPESDEAMELGERIGPLHVPPPDPASFFTSYLSRRFGGD